MRRVGQRDVEPVRGVHVPIPERRREGMMRIGEGDTGEPPENTALPKIEVDPDTYSVKIDGENADHAGGRSATLALQEVSAILVPAENARFLKSEGALPEQCIRAVETGSCPLAAIRDDVAVT